MAYDSILEEVKDLSEENQAEVLDFIMFLKSKKSKNSASQKNVPRPKRELNTLAGKLIYMADDFDETPECLAGYL